MSQTKVSELPLAASVTASDVLVGNAGVTTSRVKIDQAGGVPIFDGVVKAVVYDAGWPTSRPNASTVFAVGGDAEPVWLTSNDVWIEAGGEAVGGAGAASVSSIPSPTRWSGPVGPTLPTGFYEAGDQLIAVSFELDAAAAIDRLACEVTTAGSDGALVRLGLYDSLSSGLPGDLVASGEATGDTTGVKEVTVSASLGKGRYWVGALSNRTGVDRPQLGGWFDRHIGASMGANTFANARIGQGTGISRTPSGISTLPATFGAAEYNNTRRAPFIAVRFA